jgi:nucleoside-triphosphatase
MQVFLTGEKQVGKSTAIRRFTETLSFTPGGFRTLFCETGASGDSHLFLVPFGVAVGAPDLQGRERVRGRVVPPKAKPVAARYSVPRRLEVDSAAFDAFGGEILSQAAAYPLIIMDELGFMEAAALGFQTAVLDTLAAGSHVLGVIKPERNPFLDAVRGTPGVTILTVTEENREEIPGRLSLLFRDLWEEADVI